MEEKAAVKTITLDGRIFERVSQSLPASQEDYVSGYLGKAGATELIAGMLRENPDPELQAEERERGTKAFLYQILVSGYKANVLAGVLTERGTTWTRTEADRNAKIFEAIVDGEQKLQMKSLLVAFVLFFFLSLEISSPTSPKSSEPKSEALDTSKEEPATSVATP